jgi:adenine phosphoribosyltransferase
VLATGGTLVAARELVSILGGTVVGTAVLMELSALDGRAVVGDVHAVFTA